MKHSRLRIEQLESRCLLSAAPVITEFLASNEGNLQDEDGDFSDWIEIANRGDQAIDLAGWHLTDSADNLTRWSFPSLVLAPGDHYVVFASGKDRAVSGQQLHTSFSLSADGEYLALVRPDGLTVASEFAPEFPPQTEDVSFGLGSDVTSSVDLVVIGSPVKVFVPANGSLGTSWTSEAFSPTGGWISGTTGVGYSQAVDPEPSIVLLQLDFNDRAASGQTAAGFSSFVVGSGNEIQTSSITRSYGALDVTLSDVGGAGYQDRHRNGNPANSGDFTDSLLLTDFVFSGDQTGTGGLDVSIAGLTPGEQYTLTLWSFDTGSSSNRVSDWTVNGVVAKSNYTFDGNNDPTNNSQYKFGVVVQASSQGNIVLSGRRDLESLSFGVYLNALKLETGNTLDGAGGSEAIRLDFNDRTEGESGAANTESGYTPMTLEDNGADFGGVKFTFSPFNGSSLDDRDRPGPLDSGQFTLGQVYDDHILSTGPQGSGLDLLIEGLVPGVEYDVLLRMFDPTAVGSRSSSWTEESSGQSIPIATPYVFDGSIAPTTNSSYTAKATLTSSANGTLLIRGVQNGMDRSVALCALELSRNSFSELVNLDLESAMKGTNSSVYLRQEFTVADLAAVDRLQMDIRYDAGFVAYLNGQEVARRNAPTIASVAPSFNASATVERSLAEAVANESLDLSPYISLLNQGANNVLAIHGLNSAAGDANFLMVPTLRTLELSTESFRYFLSPTPGAVNGEGVLGFVGPTSASVPGGLYDGPIQVQLSPSTAGATIYYTLDGSIPGPTNSASAIYSSAIPISSTTILRIKAYQQNYASSTSQTYSYLFLEDVLIQNPLAGLDAANYPLFWQANASGDYSMDPRVVALWDDDNPANTDLGIRESLASLPTMSIVLDHEDLWGAQGIYPNATSEGPTWRRPGSVEYFDPATGERFQHNVGVQMHGNASRDNVRTKKHSFRLIFSSEYEGPGRLEFPLFDNTDFADINTVVLRASFTDSFATRTATGRYSPLDSTYTRDVFMRDTQLAMGSLSPASTYVHLYINGLYWGLYNPAERTDDAFLASHLGGNEEDWDIIRDFNELYRGGRNVYDQMFNIADQIAAGSATTANTLYHSLQGLNPDGSVDPAGTKYLDVDNFIDYMILHLYAGVEDWPSHNWVAARNRVDPEKGFQWFTWDQEIAFDGRFRDRTEASDDHTPAELFVDLRNSSEFRLRFADRVERHLFNGGALTTEANADRWLARADQIEGAIIAESARWGDAREGEVVDVPPVTTIPLMTVNEWRESIDEVLAYFPQSHSLAISRFRADGLFPNILAPTLNQYSGSVSAGFDLSMTSPSGGTIWYTLNGEDPRQVGGAINSGAAMSYAGTIDVTQSVTVKARTLVGSVWSPLVEAELTVAVGAQGIVISEFNYHPHAPTLAESAQVPGVVEDDFEFIELMNTHPTQSINLSGMSLANGLSYTFGSATLAPGQRAVVVEDVASYEARYGTDTIIFGEWSGGLSNSGETIELRDSLGNILSAVAYLDEDPWGEAADGDGGTMELVDPYNTPVAELGKWYRWRVSTEWGGTPGMAGSGPIGVVVNEVRVHSASPEVDAIELFNTTTHAIDISGWYLSDSGGTPLKFPIPQGILLQPGAYVVFDEEDFNPSSPAPGQIPFALSALQGDDVYLVVPNGNGGVSSIVDVVHFGAAAEGQSFGRVDTEVGRLAPLARPSFGGLNGLPAGTPIVITEVESTPAVPTSAALAIDSTMTVADLRFVELHNATASTMDLHNYRLAGAIGFDFASSTLVTAGGSLVLVPFNPSTQPSKANAFRAHYGISVAVQLIGPFSGTLLASGGRIELQEPDQPSPEQPGTVPRVRIDEILYDDQAPWPDSGQPGASLHRMTPAAFGDDGQSWRAAAATPGSVDFAASATGDFNGDETIDLVDLQMLVDAVELGSEVIYFDLTGDNAITLSDIANLAKEVVHPIAGDYDWNGVVDAADYQAWKASFHSSFRLNADGNADGTVNLADYTIWRDNLGASAPLLAPKTAESSVQESEPFASLRTTASDEPLAVVGAVSGSPSATAESSSPFWLAGAPQEDRRGNPPAIGSHRSTTVVADEQHDGMVSLLDRTRLARSLGVAMDAVTRSPHKAQEGPVGKPCEHRHLDEVFADWESDLM
ncbi:lamin tail domain-containing protein [Aeoliella sp. SH292]|uniref:lamin tail domain-containing protein n=1 Tax=Aeoliella sp. SH292 TaxID=3454464 RepID=UPI003F98BE9B